MTTFVSAAATRGINWNTSVTNATFQAWATRVKAMLDGVGLVQTSDTGQMNVATATFPVTNNADSGYLIYRFADSVQGTYPIFLRFGLGRGGDSARCRLTVSIGQGSNGSGTLTGAVLNAQSVNPSGTSQSIDPVTTDYACHQDGYLGFAQGAVPDGQNYAPRFWFCIQRTRHPDTGVFDGEGVILIYAGGHVDNNPPVCIPWIFSVGAVQYGGTGYYDYGMAVGDYATDSNGYYIAWPHIYFDRGVVRTMWASWGAASVAFPNGAYTFDAAPYGTTRRWITFGSDTGRGIRGFGVYSSANTWTMPLLWEA